MGGSGVGLDSGGGSRGASLGGRGMRAMFSPPSIHHKSKSLPGGLMLARQPASYRNQITVSQERAAAPLRTLERRGPLRNPG